MKRLNFILLASILFVYPISGRAKCVDCGNSLTDAFPVHTQEIEEVAAMLPCRVQNPVVENDPFAVDLGEKSSGDECGCIIGKNLEKIKEKHLEQKERRKEAFAEMMEARFFASSRRLSHLGHNLELSGRNIAYLAQPGGSCNIVTQFKKLSCADKSDFSKKLKEYFPAGRDEKSAAIFQQCDKQYGVGTIDALGCAWRLRGAEDALGLEKSRNPTSVQCMNNLELEVVAAAKHRTSSTLRNISEFLNRDGLTSDLKLDYKLFDNLVRQEGMSPRVALERLKTEDSSYSDFYNQLRGYPLIIAMLDDVGSFEELKGIFSGDVAELSNPERFMEKHFGDESNDHINTIVKNIKEGCDDYTKDLEMLLCGEADNPYVLNRDYRGAFLDSWDSVENIDSVDRAFECHARYCQEGKMFEGLEGYCLLGDGKKSYQDSFLGSLKDFGADVANVSQLRGFARKGGDALQSGLCPFLACPEGERRQKKKMCTPGQLNDVEELLAQECPLGPALKAPVPCDFNSYAQLNAYGDYQKRLNNSPALYAVKEVPDLEAEPNEDGEYPTKQVRERRQSFVEALWGISPPSTAVEEVVTRPKNADSAEIISKKEYQDQAAPLISQPASAPVAGAAGNGHREVEQARRLADAAISMAESAERLTQKAAANMKKSALPEDIPQKIASFAPADNASADEQAEESLGESQDNPAEFVPTDNVKKMKTTQTPFRTNRKSVKELGDSVIDIGNDSVATIDATTSTDSTAEEGVEAGHTAIGSTITNSRRLAASSQVLTLDKTELPELVGERLEEQGIDTAKPFMIEVVVDGKVIKVAVKPFIFEGKTLYRPELDQIKESNPELYQAIRKSPIFKDYVAFERDQKVYRWGDVLKILSKAKAENNNA